MTEKYFKDICNLLLSTLVTDNDGKTISLDESFQKATDLILKLKEKNNKLIFIGNGGSASIASHMATDFLKNGKIPALAFNDSILLTCLGNDLGYENVFKEPIEILAKRGDILVSISSSGSSANILRASQKAREKGCSVVTLSGFNSDNPLRQLGDINFYIQSDSYGYVEIAHSAICHCLVDKIIKGKHK